MKTIQFILFILFLIVFTGKNQAQNQQDLPYRPLSSFSSNELSDTLQYLQYNFFDRQDQYKGKKISEVIQDLELPITRFGRVGLRMGVVPVKASSIELIIKQFGDEPDTVKDYYIMIRFATPFEVEDFKKSFGRKDNRMTPEIYEMIKDLEIEYVESHPDIITERK